MSSIVTSNGEDSTESTSVFPRRRTQHENKLPFSWDHLLVVLRALPTILSPSVSLETKKKAWSSVERACVSKEGAHQSYFLPMLFCKHLLLSIDEDDKKLGVLWQAFGSTCHRLFYAATHNTSLCQFPSFHGCGTPFPEVKNRKSSLKILLQISTSNASKYFGGFILSKHSYSYYGKADMHVLHYYK